MEGMIDRLIAKLNLLLLHSGTKRHVQLTSFMSGLLSTWVVCARFCSLRFFSYWTVCLSSLRRLSVYPLS